MSKLKIVGLTAAGIIAVQLVGAKLIGSNIASSIKAVTDSYQNMTAIPLRVVSSNASWFKTDITLGVKLPPNILQTLGDHITPLLTPIDGENYLTLSETFQHGPFILKDGLQMAAAYSSGEFKIPDRVEQLIKDALNKNETLSDKERTQLFTAVEAVKHLIKSDYQLSIGFDGQLRYSTQMEQAEDTVQFVNKRGKEMNVAIKVPTAAATVVYDTAAQALTMDGTSESPLSLSGMVDGRKFHFEMGAYTLAQTSTLLTGNIWTGDTDFSLSNIIINIQDPKAPVDIQFGQSSFTHKMVPADQGTLNFDMAYDFKDMVFGTPQGPVSLDEIHADFSAMNIDQQLIATYNKMNQMTMQAVFTADEKGMKAADQYTQTAFPDAFAKALEKKPLVKLNNFSVTKAGHQSDLTMTATLKDGYTLSAPNMQDYIIGDGVLSLNKDMMQALAMELATLNPRMTADQLKQVIQQQLDAFTAQGLLTQSGVRYTSDLSFKDGFILMNGTPVAPLK